MHTKTISSSITQTLLSLLGLIVFLSMTNSTAKAQPANDTSNLDQGFAVVELFTSQGCSSCPSADKNLMSIAERAEKSGLRVYTLSFHVDYWNYLGWDDPYSSVAATKRQRQYASVLNSRQVYTPQMIVNGTNEFVGSKRDLGDAAIQKALRVKASRTITGEATSSRDGIEVNWKVSDANAGDLLVVALVQNHASENVTAGENTGEHLSHVNVVRNLQIEDAASQPKRISFKLPEGLNVKDAHVILFVQSKENAAVLGATQLAIR